MDILKKIEKKMLKEEEITTPNTKTFDFKVDSWSGTVKAENIKHALNKVVGMYFKDAPYPTDESFKATIYIKMRKK